MIRECGHPVAALWMLWFKFENGQIWPSNTQQVATHRNIVAQLAQRVAPNNVVLKCCNRSDVSWTNTTLNPILSFLLKLQNFRYHFFSDVTLFTLIMFIQQTCFPDYVWKAAYTLAVSPRSKRSNQKEIPSSPCQLKVVPDLPSAFCHTFSRLRRTLSPHQAHRLPSHLQNHKATANKI